MVTFINHKLEEGHDGGYVVYLYLNESDTEMATELGKDAESEGNWQDSISNYIKEKLPNIKVNVVKVMLGSLVLSSTALLGSEALASTTTTEPTVNQTMSSNYTVSAGDTLYLIAKKYNISVDQLKSANQMTSDLIRIGQVLIIPANETVTSQPSVTSTVPTGSVQTTSYTVISGDSLSLISKKFAVTVDQIKQANNLTTDLIFAGQTLKIPVADSQTTMPTSPTSGTSATTTNSSYTIVAGDNLWLIANRFGTTVDAIKSLNNLQSTVLQIGQVLKIPAKSTASTQSLSSTYTVVAGDSLSLIAKKYSTTIDTIKQLNNLSSDLIKVGQILKVPTATQETTAPTPEPTVTNDAPAPAPSVIAEVQTVQKQLQDLGYYSVPTFSGTNDTPTSQAISTFQSDYGIPVTGAIDATTKTEIEHAIVKKALVKSTMNYLGVPYKWGGTTPAGFDCSGFVYFMFNSQNVPFQRSTSDKLYLTGKSISKSNLQPGDLVFFGVNTPGVVSHVGFYMGDNQFISATSSKGIWNYSMDHTYWSKYYIGAKRVY